MSPRRRRRRGPVTPPKDVEMRIDNMLALVKDTARDVPGVYRMTAVDGEVIYVGKSKTLRTRLLSYFRAQFPRDKGARILREAATLEWEPLPNEFSALLRELRLIKQLRPRYNVLGVPGLQRHHYICVGKSPAPYVHVTTTPSNKEQGVYGPFVKWGKSDDAARRLNDLFKLRDCPQTVPLSFAEQGELFDPDRGAKCLRFELGTGLADLQSLFCFVFRDIGEQFALRFQLVQQVFVLQRFAENLGDVDGCMIILNANVE